MSPGCWAACTTSAHSLQAPLTIATRVCWHLSNAQDAELVGTLSVMTTFVAGTNEVTPTVTVKVKTSPTFCTALGLTVLVTYTSGRL